LRIPLDDFVAALPPVELKIHALVWRHDCQAIPSRAVGVPKASSLVIHERIKCLLDDDVLTLPAFDENLLRALGAEFDDGYRGKGGDRCGESAGQSAHSKLPEVRVRPLFQLSV
jgi:hypothetical protein